MWSLWCRRPSSLPNGGLPTTHVPTSRSKCRQKSPRSQSRHPSALTRRPPQSRDELSRLSACCWPSPRDWWRATRSSYLVGLHFWQGGTADDTASAIGVVRHSLGLHVYNDAESRNRCSLGRLLARRAAEARIGPRSLGHLNNANMLECDPQRTRRIDPHARLHFL